MKSLVISCLVALAHAGPLAVRDAPTVLSDIQTLSQETVKLNDTITKLGDGSGSGALPGLLAVQMQSDKVADATNKTVQDVKNSAPFDGAESGSIAVAVLNFVPVINSTVDNLIAHKPAVDKASFGIGASLVLKQLQKINGLAKDLGDNLTDKLASPYKELAPQVSQQIQDIFARGIAAYSAGGSGGGFPGFPSPSPGGSPFPGFPAPSGGSPFPGFPSKA